MIDDKTTNFEIPLPNVANNMRNEDLPRLRYALSLIDETLHTIGVAATNAANTKADQTQVDTIDGRLATAEETIGTHSSALVANASTLGNHETRLSATEGSIGGLGLQASNHESRVGALEGSRGVANGIAQLDSAAKVPSSQLSQRAAFFTSSTTWVVPAGVTLIEVSGSGGGGGGGGGATNASADMASNGTHGGSTSIVAPSGASLVLNGGGAGGGGSSDGAGNPGYGGFFGVQQTGFFTDLKWEGFPFARRAGSDTSYGAARFAGARGDNGYGGAGGANLSFGGIIAAAGGGANGGEAGRGYGAGGGGGGASLGSSGYDGGGGGGAGRYVYGAILAVVPGETITVTIGAGGAGGAKSPLNTGSNGGAGGNGAPGYVFLRW